MPLMGADSRRLYAATSALGGGLAGLGAALMVLQFDIYPQIGLQFGPLIFMVCVLGSLGNMLGGFLAAAICGAVVHHHHLGASVLGSFGQRIEAVDEVVRPGVGDDDD